MIRTALAGFGDSAHYLHAPFLLANPAFELTHVFERSKNRASEAFPFVTVVRSLEELLAEPNIDLVIINTPNETHTDYTRQALQAGKHVVVEKPFTPTVEEAEELISLAKEKNRVLTVYHNRRWDSDFRTVQQVLTNGELGELVSYEAQYDRYKPILNVKAWKETPSPGSGTLYDLGSHILDQALVLFGKPKSVSAEVWKQREGTSIDDAFDIRLAYENLRVRLRSSLLVREPGPRYILHGKLGSFLKPGIDIQEDQLKAGEIMPGHPNFGVESEALWGLIHTELDGIEIRRTQESLPGNWGLFYQNVADAIEHGADIEVNPEQVITQLQVIEAAYKSSKTGQVVHI
ncbi:MAG: Gfo/Idh/MocA family oxidoreductase [Siphonobacter sp.]